MTPDHPVPSPSSSAESAGPNAPVRRRWRRRAVLAAVVLIVAVVWPRRQRIALSNGSSLEVTRVTIGPRHTCPIPVTVANIKAAVARRQFHWLRFETFEADNTIGLWFEKPVTRWDDALYLVDRSGWRWAPLNLSRESPILFPPMDHRSPVEIEVIAGGSVHGRSRLAIPAGTCPRDDWKADSLPVERTDGPLHFELKGFEVTAPEKIPSEASVRLKMEMTWRGHAFRPAFVSPLLVDTCRREDRLEFALDGRFTTHLSPHDTLWQLRFLVGRDREQPLEADEEIVVEPQWGDTGELRVWDQTVAGIPCRFAVSRSIDKITVPSLLPGARIPWRALGTKVLAEPKHGAGASVRIDFLAVDGKVIHRGIVQKLDVTADRRLTARAYGANGGAVKLPDRYRIRVGIDVPRPVLLTLRPEVSP